MIGEWVPADTGISAIDPQRLQQFAAQAETLKSDADAVRQALGEEALQQARGWLRLEESAWQEAISALAEKDLFPLAVFFTLAENAFSGWQCGARNPAIWLFRHMKEKGNLPDKTEVRALKTLTDNRYIPYGSAL